MIYHTATKHSGPGESYSLHDLDAEARTACKNLKPHLDQFDVIAVTGLSGILPAVPVSLKMKVPVAILRKPGDDTHQCGGLFSEKAGAYWVNGKAVKGRRVLWLDDFTASGDTRKRIRAAVAEAGGQVVAEYMTRDKEFVPWVNGQPDWSA